MQLDEHWALLLRARSPDLLQLSFACDGVAITVSLLHGPMLPVRRCVAAAGGATTDSTITSSSSSLAAGVDATAALLARARALIAADDTEKELPAALRSEDARQAV